MTTCKQPQPQSTPPAPRGFSRGGIKSKTFIDGGATLTPSPTRRGLGRNYLYLVQKSFPAKGGFTIVECLLAIILVSILMTAITPVIVLSVATRVQARRVEQATQAARSYIDGVQTGTIPQPENAITLDQVNKTTTATPVDLSFAEAPAPPPTALNCPDDRNVAGSIYPYCANDPADFNAPSLYCIDNDGGGCTSGSPRDYIVQAFRSAKATVGAPGVPDLDTDGTLKDKGTTGYLLGVRVYRADAFDGTSTLATTTTNAAAGGKKAATYAGGKGVRLAPLVEMTTEVRTPGTTFESLRKRLNP